MMESSFNRNESWNDIWKRELGRVLNKGSFIKKEKEGKDHSYIELIGHKFTLDDPRDRLISDNIRSINIFQCIGQFLWITQGNFTLRGMQYYQPIAERFADGVVMMGAYGLRLFGIQHLNQINYLLTILDADLTKRKAVASIYLPQFDQHDKKSEIPCTLNLQYLIRDGKVNAVTYMRSQDAYQILPSDLFIFTMIQEYITAYLQNMHPVELGTYHHFSGSFHIYSKHENEIHDVIHNRSDDKGPMGKMPPQNVEIKLNRLNNFEKVLRNAVITHKQRNKTLDFNLYSETLENTFNEEYWKQIGRILLCYGALKMHDCDAFNRFKRMLDNIYQYYIDLFLTKLEQTNSTII